MRGCLLQLYPRFKIENLFVRRVSIIENQFVCDAVVSQP